MAEQNPIVQEVQEEYHDYSNQADAWRTQFHEDQLYRVGRQWTGEEKKRLERMGHAPIVVNRIHPAVEFAKSILTSRRPSFTCAPREDSDVQVAQVMAALLEYVYDISDGETQMRQAIDDYYVGGLGWLHAYIDPEADDGKGEVKFQNEDPLNIYVDPNSNKRMFDDAKSILIVKEFTKDQAKEQYKQWAEKIQNANGNYVTDRPATGQEYDGESFFPDDIGRSSEEEYVSGYQRYSKVQVPKFRIFESFSGQEDVLSVEEFEEYQQLPVLEFQGQFITDPETIEQLVPEINKQGLTATLMTHADLIEEGLIQSVKIQKTQIKEDVVMGDTHLYTRILPMTEYPLIPLVNIYTRTPYPTSDIRLVRGLQDYINKIRSLIIAHATTITTTKVLLPKGSGDIEEFQEEWNRPGVVMEWDMDEHEPVVVQTASLPNELYQNEIQAKKDIDHQLGLHEMMMGASENAPQTYKATLAIDEFGQRRMRGKMADIEATLTRLGQVLIPMMQELYKGPKVFQLVQPNNSLSEYKINKQLVDDKTQEIEVINDITVGKYDVVVVSGSTLPTNRYAQFEMYMEAYQNQIIDRVEVLKKTEIFDMEGVLQRTDMIAQLQQQLAQAEEIIKNLKGDMQTKDREIVHLRNRVETEKFKTKLSGIASNAKAAGELYQERLKDSATLIGKELSQAQKQNTNQSSPS